VKRNWIHDIAFVLLILGGVNWGLVGLFDIDIVERIFGSVPTIGEIVYVLIGAAAVYVAVTHQRDCKICSAK